MQPAGHPCRVALRQPQNDVAVALAGPVGGFQCLSIPFMIRGNGGHSEAYTMRRFRGLLLLCAAVACIESGRMQALAYTDFGQGRPIAAKDIAGKTICWSRKGAGANFAANGQYTDQHRPGYHD